MTIPAGHPIEIRRGSTGDYATIILAILQLDGVTPIPLAGATVALVITQDGKPKITKTTADGSLGFDAANAKVTWVPTAAETSSIRLGQLDRYAVTIQFSNGSFGPYLNGPVTGLDFADEPEDGCANSGAGLSSLVRVIKLLVPGTPGPAGPPAGTLTKRAARALSGHKIVKAIGAGAVDYASSDSPADAGAVLGITLGAANGDASVNVQSDGEMAEPTWSWRPGAVFLGIQGALTQTPPLAGLLQQIGVATTPTTILVAIQTPFLRA